MATKVVKANAELVPSIKSEELSIALAELAREAAALPELKLKVDAQLVTNAGEYAEMGTLLTGVRSIGKVGAFKINPFLEVAARVTNFLRGERTKHEDVAAAIANTASTKMADYKRQEREAAEAEQRRINEQKRIENDKRIAQEKQGALERAEEIRKERVKEINGKLRRKEITSREAAKLLKEAGADAEAQAQNAEADAEAAKNIAPPQVTVQPNVPKVAGTRGRIQYFAQVTSEDLLIEAFLQSSGLRRTYLRQFIQINERALGQEALDVKNSTTLNASIPGVKFWDEDKV